jgi:hypothetical protein
MSRPLSIFTPAQAGVQRPSGEGFVALDSRLRGNDGEPNEALASRVGLGAAE